MRVRYHQEPVRARDLDPTAEGVLVRQIADWRRAPTLRQSPMKKRKGCHPSRIAAFLFAHAPAPGIPLSPGRGSLEFACQDPYSKEFYSAKLLIGEDDPLFRRALMKRKGCDPFGSQPF